MNNAKMWLVVKPTVGVPNFLSAVAIGSFAVHLAVLTNTAWVSDVPNGRALGSSATAAVTVPDTDTPRHVASLTPGSQGVLVTMPDATVARAVLVLPQEVAALE